MTRAQRNLQTQNSNQVLVIINIQPLPAGQAGMSALKMFLGLDESAVPRKS